jgi:hypothetical protein
MELFCFHHKSKAHNIHHRIAPMRSRALLNCTLAVGAWAHQGWHARRPPQCHGTAERCCFPAERLKLFSKGSMFSNACQASSYPPPGPPTSKRSLLTRAQKRVLPDHLKTQSKLIKIRHDQRLTLTQKKTLFIQIWE